MYPDYTKGASQRGGEQQQEYPTNLCQLVGFVQSRKGPSDPGPLDYKSWPDGKGILHFSLNIVEKTKDRFNRDSVSYTPINVDARVKGRMTPEFLQGIVIGMKVAVIGKLREERFESKKYGGERKNKLIAADDVVILEMPQQQFAPQAPQQGYYPQQQGGYAPQQPGYAPYPQQPASPQGGYPPQGGYNPYPQQGAPQQGYYPPQGQAPQPQGGYAPVAPRQAYPPQPAQAPQGQRGPAPAYHQPPQGPQAPQGGRPGWQQQPTPPPYYQGPQQQAPAPAPQQQAPAAGGLGPDEDLPPDTDPMPIRDINV